MTCAADSPDLMLPQNVSGVGEVATLLVQTSGSGTWMRAASKWGGMWEVDSIPGPGPYALQITLTDGQLVRPSLIPSLENLDKMTPAPYHVPISCDLG